MRIGNKKTDYVFKAILCMLIFVFSVTIASEVKAADSICAGHESFITEEIEVSSYRTEKNADGQYTSVPKSQSGDGWIFAGWYKDAACTEALEKSVTSGTYVAKFVPAHVLGVKAQVSANLLNDDEEDDTTGSIRFVTSLDSLKFSKAGFKVILHEGAEPIISASKYAYSKLYAVGSTETVLNYIASDVFCSQSQYFKACTVVDIAKEDFDSEIVVTPFWITRDGTIVEGETVSKSVQQGIDACRVFEENEAWNLLRQSEGVIYKTNGGWGEAKFHKQYENFDLRVQMKLYSRKAREAVKFVFNDNKSLAFSLLYNENSDTARFDIMDDKVDGTDYALESAWDKFQLTEEEFKKLTTADEGIELRVVRVGTTFYVYLDGTLRYQKDYSANISATEKATVSIRHWYDDGVNKGVPFTITEDVSSAISIASSENGTVTTDKTSCVHGETVTLTAIPDESYYCTELKVNGKEVTLSSDGTCTFAATETEHMVEAVFAKKVFEDNSAWDLSRQDEGIIVKTNGGWGEAKFCEQYENFDLSVKMKLYSKDAREAVKIVFDDNKSLTFSLYYNKDADTARFDIMEDKVDGVEYALESAWNKFQLTEEEFKKLTTEDEGIELRIVRVGTTFNVYLDGTVRYTKDYADQISATEKATVSIRHWGDGNVNKDVSFTLMEKVFEDNSAWDLSRQDEGIIVKTNGGWGEAKFCEQYENFDLSVKMKLYSKDAREAVKIVFDDNKSLTFSLYYNKDADTARFDIMEDKVDGVEYALESAWNKFQLTEEEFKKLTTEDEGIELRIVRVGTTFYVHLDGTIRYTKDYADKISEKEKATISIRHWGDGKVNKDVPFTITDDVSTTISIASNENGEVTTDKTSYNHGDTVTLTATPNEGYYCTGIKVDGQEVSGNGSYSFTATKANYKVEGAFAKKVMDSTIGDWDLLRQDEGIVVKTNGGWGETQLVESYENIDLSMWVKVHSEIGGTGAKVVFSNNRSISFRMFLEKGTAKLQLMDDKVDNVAYHLVESWGQYTLTDTEKAKLTSTDANEKGIEVRFVRVGTKCYIYVEGTQRYYADFSENIGATDKATVYFRHWNDGGNNVEIPFTITDDVSSNIVITPSENGAVTSDKTACVHGDTVKLTVTPNESYYCTELKVNGKEVTLSSDGTHTFAATETEHMVEAVFAKKVMDSTIGDWDLSRQDEGIIVKTNGGWGETQLVESYENIDLSMWVKVHSEIGGTGAKVVFSNNRSISFRMFLENGTAKLQLMDDKVDNVAYHLVESWGQYTLTDTEKAKLTSTDANEKGIEVRFVRVGTKCYIYVEGTQRYYADFSENIGATDKATVYFRHWNDGGNNVEIPFTITDDVSATISIASSVNGKVTSDKTSYVHGDTVVLTATPREGYYCTELTIDGEEVTLNTDGTYTFTPTKAKYKVKSVFARKVIVSTQGNWDLSRQDEGVIVKTGGDWGEAGFCEQYENFDLSVWMKAYTNGAREAVYIVFGNNKTLTFSVINESGTGQLQLMTDNSNHLDVNWNLHAMTSEETAKITSQTGKGIELRIVRFGTIFYVYLDGTRVYHKDFYGQIDGDDAASVYIRHWEDKEVDKDISFKMTNRVAEVETVSEASTELFYINDKKTEIADPFVLDNTKVDGYYYLYGTKGKCYCYRSTNMVDWETIGSVLDVSDEEISKVVATDVWAPEVVYDSSTELYYLFFSATPEKVNSDNVLLEKLEQSAQYQLMVAVSEKPDKNFQLVNFKDATSCGTDNLHTYSEDTYSQYYAKYFMLDPAEYKAFANANGGADEDNNGYTGAIDPHPYVDSEGNKYLFWVDNKGENRICGVKMENWLQPNWDTATVLTYSQYYTVADWKAAQSGETVETVSYELETSNINEGPVITEHNGKYYLTFSVNTYTDSSYQVAQAVADSPLGTYRKLKEKEGGLLLSANAAGSQEISGTGHHSFVTIGEQTYIAYHRHDDFTNGGAARNHAIDEVKWVKNADDLEVMYVNGPTCTIQPQPVIENITKYKNIAGDATLIGPEDACYLTDGLLSVNKNGNADFMQYINETSISETTTFAFEFESARTVGAIMVYNSKMEDTCFTNISKIEFLCEENGRTVVHYINNVQFNSEYYKTNEDGTINYIIPGSAAWAGFNEMKVNAIRITVDVPENQTSVGISEIRILGK